MLDGNSGKAFENPSGPLEIFKLKLICMGLKMLLDPYKSSSQTSNLTDEDRSSICSRVILYDGKESENFWNPFSLSVQIINIVNFHN